MENRKTDIPVIVCIGSTTISGDSLGPMVGDLLRKRYNLRAFIYGGFRNPVNASNYLAYIKFIKDKHPSSIIVAVDACVGDPSDIGKIKYTLFGIHAGGALKRQLPKIGDIGVLGIVASRQSDNLRALSSVPPQVVKYMSDTVALCVSKLLSAWHTHCRRHPYL
jgi:putative sporulation protein YyaC